MPVGVSDALYSVRTGELAFAFGCELGPEIVYFAVDTAAIRLRGSGNSRKQSCCIYEPLSR
jgi:hypothetical protein